MNKPLLLFILFALLGFGLLTAGVFVLSGSGWSLLAGAVSCFSIAGFIRKGLISE